jgi:hypothetical protein
MFVAHFGGDQSMRKRIFTGAVAILALGSIALPTVADARGVHIRNVRLEDRCDPASFNAEFGEGICIPHSGELVTLPEFLEELNPVDFGHDKWRNKPDEVEIRVGDELRVTVRGGEGHSFTEVPEIVAGCLPDLNAALGLDGPAPTEAECFGPGGIMAVTGVAPNGLSTLPVSGLDRGSHLFMCFTHPWMTTVVNVR